MALLRVTLCFWNLEDKLRAVTPISVFSNRYSLNRKTKSTHFTYSLSPRLPQCTQIPLEQLQRLFRYWWAAGEMTFDSQQLLPGTTQLIGFTMKYQDNLPLLCYWYIKGTFDVLFALKHSLRVIFSRKDNTETIRMYGRTSTYGHLSTTANFFCDGGPLYNGNDH